MLGPIRPQVIFSQSKLSKQHSRTIERWLMWHFTGRGDKRKEEISHVLVFCVPRLPSSLLCFSTWEDVLCGRPHLDSLAIWLPDGLANGRSRQKTGGEAVGAFLPHSLLSSLQFCRRLCFSCWVAPLSHLWPSLGSSHLTPSSCPSAPMGGNGFLQFLVYGCFTSPL